MSKKEFYCQCRMKKKIDDWNYEVDVAWIPEKFAKIGKLIKIKQDDGTWDNNWEVFRVYSKVEAKYVESRERDYLKQREVSDV